VDPELVTAITGGIGSLLVAWNGFQARQLKQLRDEVSSLTGWRASATGYIGTLLFLMAERGIQAPRPPAELGLMPIALTPDSEQQQGG
jgi:hypothetical protein